MAALALSPAAASAERSYVVMLKEAPTASAKNTTAQSQDQRVDRAQSRAIDRAGGNVKPFYSYRTAFAGFAAKLSGAEVDRLRRAPEVFRVWRNRKQQLQDAASDNATLDGTTAFPDSAPYLGLPLGLWDDLGGSDQAGDGVIVGVIDGGITPQHPSFADTPAGNYIGTPYSAPPDRFGGACDVAGDPQADTPAEFCNDKLIGARWFVDGFGEENVSPGAALSPRDDDGHGTHTASTAAGNFGVDPSIGDNDLGVDRISGIAPRARVAAYKVCWIAGEGEIDGCTYADTVAAIDAAVADGVDVINYSVGSDTSLLLGPDEYAYLGASDAGVFVANSAGNAGPGEGTVGSPTSAPWLTSVAATNPQRTFASTATITPAGGTPFDVTGASITDGLPAAPLVDAATSGLAGVPAANAELCQPDTLDPAKVDGTVVLCLRGVNDRIEKSEVVADAGGVGMILYNPTEGQDIDTDLHYVPTTHVSKADGDLVKAAIAAGPATAALTAGQAAEGTPKTMAAFSSRGPQEAVPDLVKPDVAAPGVNILAGNTPDQAENSGIPDGFLFQSISGTSMASPHVAGAGALLKQSHPEWTPAEIKSALMLTADDSLNKEDGTTPATPFDQGAGEIDPTAADRAGLVLDATTDDYLRYLDTQDPTIVEGDSEPLPASDLNLASIGASEAAGTFATARTVRSTLGQDRRWTASATVPGFETQVSGGGAGFPTFTVPAGGESTVTIAAKRTDAPLGEYAFGTLTLQSGQQVLHLPITIKPVAVAAPRVISVTTDQPAGSSAFTTRTGFDGALDVRGWGFAPADVRAGEQIGTSATGAPVPGGTEAGNTVYDLDVPEGAQLVSGQISNADGGDPSTDLDLFLYYDANADGVFAAGEVVDESASAASDESITALLPDGGKYRMVVVGFATADPSTYDLSTWVVNDTSPDDPANAPGLRITGDPFAATIGGDVTPTLEWSAVDKAGTYLGVATFGTAEEPILDGRVVALTKTVDNGATYPTPSTTPTPPPTPSPSPTPSPEPTASPTPTPPYTTPPGSSNPRPRLRIRKVKAKRGRVVVRVRSNRRMSVGLTVKRNGKRKSRAARETVRAGANRRIVFKLRRPLKRGKRYKFVLDARAGGKTSKAKVRTRVRR